MKKVVYGIVGVVVALCIVLLVVWFVSHSTNTKVENEVTKSVAVASGHPEWPPIMFKSGSNIDGAGVALVKKIFTDLNIDVSFPYVGLWDEVQAKAKSGEVDVLVAAYKTTAREEYMVYSDAYTTDPVVIFVKAGKAFPYAKNEDLIPKRGLAMVGDSYGQAFDDFEKASLHLPRLNTSQEAFAKLADGSADYFIYSLYAAEDYIKKNGLAGQFESLPKHINDENFYITISKKSALVNRLPEINALIEKYKADGTIDQLINSYK